MLEGCSPGFAKFKPEACYAQPCGEGSLAQAASSRRCPELSLKALPPAPQASLGFGR